MMLAELCWNFAWAYSQKDGISEEAARDALKEGWVQGISMAKPTAPRPAER
ncbi:MAG: hypothetical protein HZY74_07620 [Brevundimonas sp.]|nr:MAG: hypothetical protein HZY74_07620 [Brevundimonas sp.]